MFNSDILEILVGMVFVYVLLSLITSSITELIANIFALRARNLQDRLRQVLNEVDEEVGGSLIERAARTIRDARARVRRFFRGEVVPKTPANLAEHLYDHPVITSLMRVGNKRLSYIPSRDFATALFGIIRDPEQYAVQPQTLAELQEAVESLPNERVRTLLQSLIGVAREPDQPPNPGAPVTPDTLHERAMQEFKKSVDDLRRTRLAVEAWYDEAMNRLSGLYRRRIQLVTFFAGIVVCWALNADSIMIFNSLSTDTTLRETIVTSANQIVRRSIDEAEQAALQSATLPETAAPDPLSGSPGAPPIYDPLQQGQTGGMPDDLEDKISTRAVENLRAELEALQILGWSTNESDPREWPDRPLDWVGKFVGIMITVLGVSLGAPFWFDLLNKLVDVRSDGRRPLTVEETVSARVQVAEVERQLSRE